MILRAHTNLVASDPVRGIADQDVTTPAIPQAGRAILSKPKRANKDNTLLKQFCECGQRAVTKRGNTRICQRCADLCTQGEPPKTAGRRERGDVGHVGYLGITGACREFFKRSGLNPCGL